MYKYELHCHNTDVSVCATITSNQLVEKYVCAGYSGIVLTNHMSSHTFRNHKNSNWSLMVDHYLSGYQSLKKAAEGRLDVFLGMELCFHGSCSEYLVYGIDEDFLYNNPNLLDMNIVSFSKLAKENGLLVFQAHPFRNRMTIVNPDYLDGYEVFNGNENHDSRNAIALEWCKKMNKIGISGSDLHYENVLPNGGIYTPEKVKSYEELLSILSLGTDLIRG